MGTIMTMTGVSAISLFIIYIIKKADNYVFEQKNSAELSAKVVKAASAFARGASDGEIREILINSIDFFEDDIEEVLSLASNHKNDEDGGYEAFLSAARQTLMNY